MAVECISYLLDAAVGCKIVAEDFNAVTVCLFIVIENGLQSAADIVGQNAAVADREQDLVEEIYQLILETVQTEKDMIRIAGEYYPAGFVKGKLLKLNYSHIEYVLECMDKNTTKVRNIKQYLLTALFNAPSTIGSYYKAAVNHDMPQYAN